MERRDVNKQEHTCSTRIQLNMNGSLGTDAWTKSLYSSAKFILDFWIQIIALNHYHKMGLQLNILTI